MGPTLFFSNPLNLLELSFFLLLNLTSSEPRAFIVEIYIFPAPITFSLSVL